MTTCTRCGRKHYGKCLAGMDICFCSGKSFQKISDCPSLSTKERDGSKAPPSGLGFFSPKNNNFLHFELYISKKVLLM